eukprot:353839-Chlamydomonas_euryale.AAC.59
MLWHVHDAQGCSVEAFGSHPNTSTEQPVFASVGALRGSQQGKGFHVGEAACVARLFRAKGRGACAYGQGGM